jgi:hypothetical protein
MEPSVVFRGRQQKALFESLEGRRDSNERAGYGSLLHREVAFGFYDVGSIRQDWV